VNPVWDFLAGNSVALRMFDADFVCFKASIFLRTLKMTFCSTSIQSEASVLFFESRTESSVQMIMYLKWMVRSSWKRNAHVYRCVVILMHVFCQVLFTSAHSFDKNVCCFC
jgi:hypothetical protein